MQYMLDTNICIYIIKKKPVTVYKTLEKLNIGDVCISAITLAELAYGVEKSQNKEKNKLALTVFSAPFEILPFSDKAAFVYGQIRAELERRGEIMGAHDMLIAAHALSENLTLVTNNTAEFQRIPGLTLENWVD